MIQLQPHPYYQQELTSGWTAQGEPATIFIAKASYQYGLDGKVEPLPESEPLSQSYDYPEDDPEQHGPSCCRETVPFKHGSEILLFASAHCGTARAGFNVEASLSTENGIHWQKKLSVVGPRTWKSTLFGTAFTEPTPITELPIRYEYAYGGRNAKQENDAYMANPVGRGYLGEGLKKNDIDGAPLPQIEHPRHPMKKPSERKEPQGYGPISSHWHPRREAFKSLDEDKAAARQYPFSGPLPDTAYHSAPRDQWFDRPLHGKAKLTLTGLTKDLPEHHPLSIHWTIPSLALRWKTRTTEEPITLQADTLLVDTQKRHLHLLYRKAFTQLPKRLMAEIHLAETSATPEAAYG
ncbi:DUF2169 family type VI secretion system accessory protein [Saccharospirillum alexandrii]|uniref:DUF2169 family type VI secretion system accessory protein n=1 Tax=Saccharospirillum alexandrii TaxID=2448477 RepID=UPI0013DF863E|nr:DUF2169 domain-containing protein [Saccharospirillum alexandrii]